MIKRRMAALVVSASVAAAGVGAWAAPAASGSGPADPWLGAQTVVDERLAGNDRYSTAVEVARQLGGESLSGLSRLIIVTGEEFPDGLAASGLAGYLDARGSGGSTAILLTRTSSVPVVTRSAIRESGVTPENIYVVGGPAAVSPAAHAEIARVAGWNGVGLNPVQRISGANRYGTAAAIVNFVTQTATTSLPGSYSTVLVASGEQFSDALAAGTLAYRNGHLLLLASPRSAPAATLGAITSLSAVCAVVLGGTVALSAQVVTQLRSAVTPGGCGTNRIGGADRYETAALIADRFVTTNGTPSTVMLVSGVEFADALSAAPLAGGNVPMLLTAPSQLPVVSGVWLRAARNSLSELLVIGGRNAIAPRVVADAILATEPNPTTTVAD
jgi:putative cell wall-binding protein